MSDEAQLVAKALAGDEDAFTALYQAHAGYVRAVGRSILRADELEDMCQETFFSAFRGLDSFAGQSGFRTWITRIAIRQCLWMLRRAHKGSYGGPRMVAMDFDTVEDDVFFRTRDVALETVPARLDAENLLRGLPPMQRRVLKMAYLEEMPVEEIAQLLGISLTALNSRLYRARKEARRKNKRR